MKTKTLREHLLDRDAAVASRLDALRSGVLSAELPGGAKCASPMLAGLRTLWRELVQPCRGTWATLAAAWVAVLAFNLLGRVDTPASTRLNADQVLALQALWREQRQWLFTLEGERPTIGPAPQTERSAQPAKDARNGLKPLGFCVPFPTSSDGAVWA